MNPPTNKKEMRRAIQAEHARMEALLASLTETQIAAPILDQNWSIKDTLAHILEWEKLMLGWVESSVCGVKPIRFTEEFVETEDKGDETMQRLNDQLYAKNRARGVADILADFRATYRRVSEKLDAVSEADIFDPNRFVWRNGSPLLDTIAGNTYGHYEEHMGWIETALKK